jgi:hypothetical protein
MLGIIKRNRELKKIGMKFCTKCATELPLTNFSPWRSSWCKNCINIRRRVRYKENPQRIKDAHIIYENNNKVKFIASRSLQGARLRARERDIPCDISVAYLVSIYDGKCYYTGNDLKPFQRLGKQTNDSPTIDRLIPDKGYVVGNVVWCSFWANKAKNKFTEEEFYIILRRILDKHGSNN